MNSSPVRTVRGASRIALRLEPECTFAAVREAAHAVREWLAARGLPESDLEAWELALVEAGNNAVEHAPEARRSLPVGIEVSWGGTDVEARVTDHTGGFDLPEQTGLPDAENEGSRGLFLIRTLTDHAEYLRGRDANTLVLRKRCTVPCAGEAPDAAELGRRLSESEAALADMAEELSSSYESLVAMFRYSAELGGGGDLRDFARRLLADLAQLTASDAVILRILGPDRRLALFQTWPEDVGAQLPASDAAGTCESVELDAARTREDVWFGEERRLGPRDPLLRIPGLRLGVVHGFGPAGQVLGTVTLVRCGRMEPFRSAQINLLHTFVDFLGIQVVNTRLLDERTKARVMRRELEIAAGIQRSLLPVSLPPCRPFELAASCLSAREVGGDYYDAIPVGDRGVLLVIADVMGKGVPAALFSALLRSTVRSMPGLHAEPAALLGAVNRAMCEDLSRVDMFATAQVAFLDPRRGRLVTAGAGHSPLLVWRPGEPSARSTGDGGLPLGIDPRSEYPPTEDLFLPGAAGLLYTDGITEARDPAGGMFGEARLGDLLVELAPQARPASELCESFQARFERYRSGAPLSDDQTFILLRHSI